MYEKPKKLNETSKTALVLSGGFTKAAFWHAGVILGLEESGFEFYGKDTGNHSKVIKTIVGSSAGALVGGVLANNFSAFDLIESQLPPYSGKLPKLKYSDIFYVTESEKIVEQIKWLNKGDILSILKKLKNKPGIFSTTGLEKYISTHIINKNHFNEYDIDFFVTATQLDHSRKCIFGKYKYPNPKHDPTTHYYVNFPVTKTISASMSVPILYEPVKIRNPNTNEYNYFLDGEIRDTLSTHVAIDNGCEKIISSWIYTPYHYQKEIGSLFNYGMPAIGIQSLNLLIQKKIVSSRANYSSARDILQTVNQYCVDQKISNNKRKKLLNILEIKLHYKTKTTFIDIYPKVSDVDFFLTNALSLSPRNIEKIVTLAKARAIEVLNNEM